ncbi:MAG: pitrilysin family protein [Planctomycetota bacterium]|nr:pitrilysin family protein [Planctomycetota bacterium]
MTSSSRNNLLALCATTLLAGCALTTRPARVPVPPPSTARVSLPDPEIFTLKNGLSVWLLHSDHVPLVAASLVIRAGSSSDPEGKAGLLSIALDMMDEGAGERSALDLADEIEFLGASLDLSTGKDYSSIDLKVLKRNFRPAFDIFSDVLLQPSFSEKEWERVKRLSLNSLRQRGEQPTSVARVVGDRLYYGDEHPYSHPEDGYLSTLEKISLDDVKKASAAALVPGNCVLLITGDLEPAALRSELEKRFADWKGPPAELPEKARQSGRISGQRLVIVDKPAAAQTVIRIYLPAKAYESPAVPHLELANTVFGGTFTSRLNSNLREDKKITYGARSGLASRRLWGHLVASSSVESGATALGISEFFRELQAMGQGVLREGELQKAAATQRSRLIENLQTQSGLLGIYSSTAAHNLQPAGRRAYYAAMAAAGEKDLEDISKEIYRWENALVVLVGDRGVIDKALAELRKNGRARGGEALEAFHLPGAEYFTREGLPEAAAGKQGK